MTAPEAMRKILSIANQYREGDNEVALSQLQRIREISAEVHDAFQGISLRTAPKPSDALASAERQRFSQKENPS